MDLSWLGGVPRTLTDNQGQDRYSTEVVVNVNGSMQMLGSRGDSKSMAPQQAGHKPAQKQPSSQPVNQERKKTQPVQVSVLPEEDETDWDSEIPF
ncbi:single-stranded DNA-binding protein (fragment) [Xenorhabdus poinarii G6]|uniref:Single-stranded DNA-binding protein n=1 Tax=Xenorhabdus poinarii G6 TaxID=1354304 RepID=A0A068R5L5_9GAMM